MERQLSLLLHLNHYSDLNWYCVQKQSSILLQVSTRDLEFCHLTMIRY